MQWGDRVIPITKSPLDAYRGRGLHAPDKKRVENAKPRVINTIEKPAPKTVQLVIPDIDFCCGAK